MIVPSMHRQLGEIHVEWLARISGNQPLLGKRSYLVVKRILDLVVVLLALPMWGPLLTLCALAIKLESPRDSVWFSQLRTGQGGKRFRMYKFRTMVPNAESLKKELAHLNELQFPDFKITNDPRITKVGKILRKTSLDELPQIINVLIGDMSLVGPRPTSFGAETYDLWHTARLDVQPGITGLWQLEERGSIEFDERLRLDIAYIEHSCLWIDLQILIRTGGVILQQRGK